MDADDKRLLIQGVIGVAAVLLVLVVLGAGLGLAVRIFLAISGLGG